MAVTVSWSIVARHHGRACAERLHAEISPLTDDQVNFFLDTVGTLLCRTMLERGVAEPVILDALDNLASSFADRLAILEAVAIVD